jgi:hypothetical protein
VHSDLGGLAVARPRGPTRKFPGIPVGQSATERRTGRGKGPPKKSCLRASWNEVTALSTADSGTLDPRYWAQSSDRFSILRLTDTTQMRLTVIEAAAKFAVAYCCFIVRINCQQSFPLIDPPDSSITSFDQAAMRDVRAALDSPPR